MEILNKLDGFQLGSEKNDLHRRKQQESCTESEIGILAHELTSKQREAA